MIMQNEENEGEENKFDSELKQLHRWLLMDEATRDIAEYIINSSLSYEAKLKLLTYAHTLLIKEFANIRGERDLQRLRTRKELIEAELPLGLTRFDLRPEYHHIVNLISLRFERRFGEAKIKCSCQRSFRRCSFFRRQR